MPARPGGPDFIGIGAQKCGTSWVADILAQHPGVLIRKKEVNFFVRRFHRGYRWYHRWFADRGNRVAGEITPNYIYSPRPDSAHKRFYPKWRPQEQVLFWRRYPSALDEIRESYPGVKVFAIFRNPVDRAWSHYWYWRNRKERLGKHGHIRPFRRMFEDDGRWIRRQGYHGRNLAPWLEAFPDMGIYLHDDLKADAAGLARRIFGDLGVDAAFQPETRIVNRGSYERMGEADRAWVADAYREDIRRFSALIGRDMAHWCQSGASGLSPERHG